MLVQETLFGTVDRVAIAIERLKMFEPPEGYYLAFSGGKDSQVIYELAKMAGVKFDAHYHNTTVDAPELVHFIKRHYPDVRRERPLVSMWQLIAHKMLPPTRIVRYCCDVLKESKNGVGRTIVTGVRWAESAKRRRRRLVEQCLRDARKNFLNVIIDWSDADVWEFLNGRGLPHCCLYDEGFTRIGCVGCPLAGGKQMRREFERWPAIGRNYRRAIGKGFEKLRGRKNCKWQSADEVFAWWIDGASSTAANEDQLVMFE